MPTIIKVTDWNLIAPAIYWVGEKLAHDIMAGGIFETSMVRRSYFEMLGSGSTLLGIHLPSLFDLGFGHFGNLAYQPGGLILHLPFIGWVKNLAHDIMAGGKF